MAKIRGGQIQNDTITGLHIEDGSILNEDIADDTIKKIKLDSTSPLDYSNLDINWLQPVSSSANLPASADDGDVIVTLDTGTIYVRSSGSWAAAGSAIYNSDDFDTDFATKTTDNLTEGSTNKYFYSHDNSQHTESYITSSGVTYDSLNTNNDIGTGSDQVAQGDHIHDARYYTETELDNGQLDNRYFTETELTTGQLDTRYYTETEIDGLITTHDHDTRYYTETELDNGQLDNRYFTETEINSNFLKLDGTSSMTGPLVTGTINLNSVNPSDTATLFGTDSSGDSTFHIRIGNGTGDKILFESWNGSAANSLLEITQSDVNIIGNLNVTGTTTTINSSTLDVSDSDITLNSGQSSPSLNASIIADRGSSTDAKIIWNEGTDKWQIDNGTGSGSDIVSLTDGDARYLLESNNLSDLTSTSTARTNLGLGTAALLTSTTSDTDETIGRALRVGDFGIGSIAVNATTDWNNYKTTGFYRGSALTNQPTSNVPGIHSWKYVLVIKHNADWSIQVAWDFNGLTSWFRSYQNGVWQSWREHGHSRNTLSGSGTFNNSAGVATTITHNFGSTSYYVSITPTTATGGYLGEYYATNILANSFDVVKTGSASNITFHWHLIAI